MIVFIGKKIALTIFGLNVQKDNSDLVLDGQTLVQQDGHYVAHVVTNFLTLCVLAHSQVLLNFAQFVHVALEKPFRLEIFFQIWQCFAYLQASYKLY